jgi:hypothetical protein
MGPAASALKTPPSDLTTLAKKHAGKFPEDYVAETVRIGKPHPSSRFIGHVHLGSYFQLYLTENPI